MTALVTTSAGPGAKLAAVINQDGTVNSATNPEKRGNYISIYATGQGVVPNAPPDGSPAPSFPAATTPHTHQGDP